MKVELTAVFYDGRGEPHMKMDLLSRNRLSVWFRLQWLLRYWKHLEITLTAKKEARHE